MGDDFPRCDRCHENPMTQTWTLRGMGPIIGDMQWRLCDECADLGTANGKLTDENKRQADRIAVLELQLEEARLEIVRLKVVNAAGDQIINELKAEKGIDALVARVKHDAMTEAWHLQEQQREIRKARCVDKCNHPADFVCDYEDGTSHCLECLAEKEVWSK